MDAVRLPLTETNVLVTAALSVGGLFGFAAYLGVVSGPAIGDVGTGDL